MGRGVDAAEEIHHWTQPLGPCSDSVSELSLRWLLPDYQGTACCQFFTDFSVCILLLLRATAATAVTRLTIAILSVCHTGGSVQNAAS